MAEIVFRLIDPQPAGSPIKDLTRAKVVLGGAGRASTGNPVLQNKAAAAASSPANQLDDLVTNGIVISRVPYTMPDEATLASASARTKEELARFVEAGIIEVYLVGTGAYTANVIRTL